MSLDAPRTFERNLQKWRWTPSSQGDPTKPPDRFTAIPGRNNYRGGAINSYEQLRMLKRKYKIRTVVNLARDSMKHQPSGKIACGGMRENACEPKWAAALGLKYIAAYLGHSPPSAAKWAEIREALAQGGVYVHCSAGVDRTGAVVARWRKEITPPGEITDAELLEYTRHFGGYWRSHQDYRQTKNKELGDWALQGRYDPSLAARVRGGGGGLLPGLALLGIGLLVFFKYRKP